MSQYSILECPDSYRGPVSDLKKYITCSICLRYQVTEDICLILKNIWGFKWNWEMKMGSQTYTIYLNLTKIFTNDICFTCVKFQNNISDTFWSLSLTLWPLLMGSLLSVSDKFVLVYPVWSYQNKTNNWKNLKYYPNVYYESL